MFLAGLADKFRGGEARDSLEGLAEGAPRLESYVGYYGLYGEVAVILRVEEAAAYYAYSPLIQDAAR